MQKTSGGNFIQCVVGMKKVGTWPRLKKPVEGGIIFAEQEQRNEILVERVCAIT